MMMLFSIIINILEYNKAKEIASDVKIISEILNEWEILSE